MLDLMQLFCLMPDCVLSKLTLHIKHIISHIKAWRWRDHAVENRGLIIVDGTIGIGAKYFTILEAVVGWGQ